MLTLTFLAAFTCVFNICVMLGLNPTMDATQRCIYYGSHCYMQPQAWAAALCYSASVDSTFSLVKMVKRVPVPALGQ